jgi:hypothetical protein
MLRQLMLKPSKTWGKISPLTLCAAVTLLCETVLHVLLH